jgi:hypothetical protein
MLLVMQAEIRIEAFQADASSTLVAYRSTGSRIWRINDPLENRFLGLCWSLTDRTRQT